VVGQKREAVASFFAKQGHQIPILIDENRSLIKAFDVFHALGVDAFRIARPSVFYIDGEGMIQYAYVSKNQMDRPSQDEIAQLVFEKLGSTLPDGE